MASMENDLGLKRIHVACLQGIMEEVVKLVCADHENLSCRTLDGATPLMLSTLMGHLSIVQFLLGKSGENRKNKVRSFPKLRDSAGLLALDYAGEATAIVQKRSQLFRHVGREHPLGVENRAEISRLLRFPARTIHRRDTADNEIALSKRGSEILVYQLVDRVQSGKYLDRQKTAGIIKARDDRYPLRYALSGYSFQSSEKELVCDKRLLDAGTWNSHARTLIGKQIGFKFQACLWDNANKIPEPEHKGRFQAGHVEIQLSCWYAIDLVRKVQGKRLDTPVRNLVPDLRILRHADIGASKRRPTLQLDYAPCKPCLKFLYCLGRYTRLSFDIMERPSVGPISDLKEFNAKTNKQRQDNFLHEFPQVDKKKTEMTIYSDYNQGAVSEISETTDELERAAVEEAGQVGLPAIQDGPDRTVHDFNATEHEDGYDTDVTMIEDGYDNDATIMEDGAPIPEKRSSATVSDDDGPLRKRPRGIDELPDFISSQSKLWINWPLIFPENTKVSSSHEASSETDSGMLDNQTEREYFAAGKFELKD